MDKNPTVFVVVAIVVYRMNIFSLVLTFFLACHLGHHRFASNIHGGKIFLQQFITPLRTKENKVYFSYKNYRFSGINSIK